MPDHIPEVDPLGPKEHWGDLTPMILFLMVAGGILTLAAGKDWAWAYIVGLILTAVWVAGFVVVRNRPERWFKW